jgi:tape measure domain-containing protein
MVRPVVWPLVADPTRYVRGFDVAESRSRKFERHMQHVSKSSTRFSASLGSIGGVAVRAMGGATVAVGGLAAAGTVLGLKTAANLETAEIGFSRLLKSSQRAKNFLFELKSFAARTPFELPGLIESSRALIGAGMATKDVIPRLTALGDATGALGLDQERFGRVVTAVTQIMNRGKVQAEELNQINEAGIPVWRLLADATGKPVPELQKLMEQGKLLAKDTLPALFDQMRKDYGGGMEEQSKSLNGVWSTFKDTVSLTLSDALQPLIPILKTALPEAGQAFQGSVQSVVDFVQGDVIPAFRTAQQWWKDNREAVRLLGEVLSSVFVPAAGEATTAAEGLNSSAAKVKAILDTVALFTGYLVLAFLRAEEEINAVLSGFASLVTFAGHALNALDRLSGGTGRAGDKLVAFGQDLKATARRELQGIRSDARNAQAAIDRLHGKNVAITGSLALKFSPTFTQRDWVQVRLAAGRMAEGGEVGIGGRRRVGAGGRDTELRWLDPTEHVWTGAEVAAAGGHAAMERWRRAVLAGQVPGLATGGPVGQIDAKTREINRVQARGTAMRMDKGLTKLASLAGGALGGLSGPGGWRWQMAALRSAFPGLALISGYRPGAITATGNRSYHAMGRAVDVPPRMDVFNWIRGRYGARTRELIFSPAGGRQVWNGRPHTYTGITRANHWDHVHWAYGKGGLIPEDVLGIGRSGRTYGFHGGETVTPKGGPVELSVASRRALARDIADALRAAPPVVQLDRQKVSREVVNAQLWDKRR